MKVFYKYLILLVILMMSGGASAWAAAGTIEAIGGADAVLVKRAGKELKLKKGDALEVGDEVITDKLTAADIRLEDKSIIRMGVNSTYKIQEDSKSKKLLHSLLNGIVRVLVPPSTDGKTGEIKFRMNTPEGTIGVRGTEFVVIRDKEETQIKGLTGMVLFGPANADFDHIPSFVLVSKGYQSAVKAKGKPGKPEKYAMPDYLKQLDNKSSGRFAPLATRTSGVMKLRSGNTATGAAVSDAAPLFAKASDRDKEEKKSAPVKSDKPKSDVNKDLMLAAGTAGIVEVEMALKLGGDVKYRDDESNTPLHAAAVNENKDAVKIIDTLLNKGADINAKNKRSQTPLMMLVIENPNPEAALLFIQRGAKLDLKDKNGNTALEIAKEKLKENNTENYRQVVELLEDEMKE